MNREQARNHLAEWLDEKTWRCFGTIDREAISVAVEALKEHEIKSLPSTTKKLNNQIHLCDYCKYNYPECPSENEDVLFGSGVGSDNVCCCAKYIVSIDAHFTNGNKIVEWIPCSERLPERGEIVLVSYKTTDKVHMCKYLDDGIENQ